MHDVEDRNNSKTYNVVFYVRSARAKTIATIKRDHGLYTWFRSNNTWIRAFHFTWDGNHSNSHHHVGPSFVSSSNEAAAEK